MRSYTDFDLGWMAGSFDGEGSVYHAENQPHRRATRPYLTLSSTDEWIIDRWVELAGGRKLGPYQYQAHHKPFWKWDLTGEPSLELATAMLPFLCPRRQEQMQCVINYVPRKKGRPFKDHVDYCTEEDCGGVVQALGLCNKHYRRARRATLR